LTNHYNNNDRIFGAVGNDAILGGSGDDIIAGFTTSDDVKQTLSTGETDNVLQIFLQASR
jgi:Ca2+-binding RTX toxin-like protein